MACVLQCKHGKNSAPLTFNFSVKFRVKMISGTCIECYFEKNWACPNVWNWINTRSPISPLRYFKTICQIIQFISRDWFAFPLSWSSRQNGRKPYIFPFVNSVIKWIKKFGAIVALPLLTLKKFRAINFTERPQKVLRIDTTNLQSFQRNSRNFLPHWNIRQIVPLNCTVINMRNIVKFSSAIVLEISFVVKMRSFLCVCEEMLWISKESICLYIIICKTERKIWQQRATYTNLSISTS